MSERYGYLIRQRAFLKLYLITELDKGKAYGQQLEQIFLQKFSAFGFQPNLTEIYRSLHDLTEEGILLKRDEVIEGAKYKKVAVYYMKDKEKARAYKKQVKDHLEQSMHILRKALSDNYA